MVADGLACTAKVPRGTGSSRLDRCTTVTDDETEDDRAVGMTETAPMGPDWPDTVLVTSEPGTNTPLCSSLNTATAQ